MIWKATVLLCVVVGALGHEHAHSEQQVTMHFEEHRGHHGELAHIGSHSPEHHEGYAWAYPSYEFSYKVEDPHTHDFKGQREHRDGDKVKGEYWLVQPDGLKRTVKYHADKHSGFHADVRYEKSNHPVHRVPYLLHVDMKPVVVQEELIPERREERRAEPRDGRREERRAEGREEERGSWLPLPKHLRPHYHQEPERREPSRREPGARSREEGGRRKEEGHHEPKWWESERREPQRREPERRKPEHREPERWEPERREPERREPERREPERREPERRREPKRHEPNHPKIIEDYRINVKHPHHSLHEEKKVHHEEHKIGTVEHWPRLEMREERDEGEKRREESGRREEGGRREEADRREEGERREESGRREEEGRRGKEEPRHGGEERRGGRREEERHRGGEEGREGRREEVPRWISEVQREMDERRRVEHPHLERHRPIHPRFYRHSFEEIKKDKQ